MMELIELIVKVILPTQLQISGIPTYTVRPRLTKPDQCHGQGVEKSFSLGAVKTHHQIELVEPSAVSGHYLQVQPSCLA